MGRLYNSLPLFFSVLYADYGLRRGEQPLKRIPSKLSSLRDPLVSCCCNLPWLCRDWLVCFRAGSQPAMSWLGSESTAAAQIPGLSRNGDTAVRFPTALLQRYVRSPPK